MKDKSFIFCIVGIILLVVLGCYTYLCDGEMQLKPDVESEQVKNTDITESDDLNKNLIPDYSVSFYLTDYERIINKNKNSDFLVFLPKVSFDDLQKKILEDNINKTLWDASTNWITDEVIEFYSSYDSSTIQCLNKNYLSITKSYIYTQLKGNVYVIDDCITIDMNTGEQVFLGDIVNVDKLCDFLLESDQYTSSRSNFWEQDDANELVRDTVKKYSKGRLLDMLKECSMEQKQFYSQFFHPHGKVCLEWKSNFYLQNTQMVIKLEEEWNPDSEIVIQYKDLNGILKEDFKQKMLIF